ncbi:MAG TPA: DNA polymerase domain-containing protein [candidate division Zixibacteria bacterium]|nr:DNA polymerase domain-containing protein [candidate division Zixibacteria bacterium]
MKVTFWLLDINYEAKDESSEIWLWGITSGGERVLIVDRNFVPYFYAAVADDADPAKVVEEIITSHCVLAAKPEIVERRLFGKPLKAVKIYCKNAEGMTKCAKQVREFEGVKDCFEDDIRVAMRYLIDNDVVPCGWHEIEATEEANTLGVRIDKVYSAKSFPKPIEKIEAPPLRVLGFSIICYSREGSPKPDRNPIIIISVATNSGEQKQFLADENRNDKPVLEAFMNYVESFDPDIIVGYGVNAQDWQYLTARCKKLGLHLRVDRAKTEPHGSVYGHVSLNGRINLDLADYADEFPEVKVKTLANLADYLGIMKVENRILVEDIDFADYWDAQAKRGDLKQFSMDNTCCIMGITETILDFAMQLSNLVCLPLDHVGTAAAGFRVEWFLIKRTHKLNELVPRRVEQPYRPYAGGLVLQPKPGLHENIAVLDFKSMYPNIMIAYNLSPDTYVSPKDPEPPGGVYVAPEVKHKFRKQPPGFYKEVLSYLIGVRNEVRLEMKDLQPKSVEYRVLDARQKAVKVITNASYGYAGWSGARWYMKPVAEAAAAWGRNTILTAIEMTEKDKLKVVYGDTDSIFIENQPDRVEKLTKEIGKKLGLEIKPDKVYVRIFFTEAKKRYAGLLPDGRLDIVGMEVVRGDWATIAKNVQEKVLEIILKEQSPKKAVDFVHQFIYELQQKRVPYRDLVIWKTLSKPAEDYEVRASHVEAAKMLRAKGWELSVGDKIGYVVVCGEGRLYERVKPYTLASYDDVDIEYYVSKQVVPAAARILESFGVTEEQLLGKKTGGKESRKLTDFFGG